MKFWMFFIVLLILSACGGSQNQISPIEKPEIKAPIAIADFVKVAQEASCSNLKNKLHVINQKQVLWDKLGNCADASFSVTLYGSTPATVLCTFADSIAGPRTSCADASMTATFNTIIQNLEKTDLGLGSVNQVQSVPVLSGSAFSHAFNSMNTHFYRGSNPKNNIFKDGDAWRKLVDEGKIDLSQTGVQSPDFKQSMVVGTFYPTPHDCSKTQIVKLITNGQALKVSYIQDEIVSIAKCDGQNANASTPMNLVELIQINLPAEFVNVSDHRIKYLLLDNQQYSGIRQKKNVVAKDQASLKNLWSEYSLIGTPIPSVDFTKSMVIGVALGERMSGCHAIRDLQVWRADNRIHVATVETTPGPLSKCALSIVTPSVLIEVPLSADEVEFNNIIISL